MKSIRIVILLVISVFFSCNPKKEKTHSLSIAVAANLQFAIKDLVETFEKETGIACEVSISSSGKLTAQIKEGAPFDVFLSADMLYPEELFRSNLTIEPPKVYAYGVLVFWSNQKLNSTWQEYLLQGDFNHLAIANPKIAPYGRSAQFILEKYNLFNEIEEKLVFGESIAQTNQFLFTGVSETGFTAKSSVLNSELEDKGFWVEIPNDEYPPITQGIVILKNSNELEAAKKFQEFLFSPLGKRILIQYGYQV